MYGFLTPQWTATMENPYWRFLHDLLHKKMEQLITQKQLYDMIFSRSNDVSAYTQSNSVYKERNLNYKFKAQKHLEYI